MERMEHADGPGRRRFDSPARAREAASALTALGCGTAREDDRTVIVTGWDPALLEARISRAEDKARNAATPDPAEWAYLAIDRFRQCEPPAGAGTEQELGQAVDLAVGQTLREAGLPEPGENRAPAAPAVRPPADGPARALLARAETAEAVADLYAGHAARTAETAVRLFAAGRDLAGMGEPAAAAAAADRTAEICGRVPLALVDEAGKTRVLEKMCRTCLTRPSTGMDYADKIIQEHVDADALLPCHSTLPWGPYPGAPPAVCAAFWARHAGDVMPGRRALAEGTVPVAPPGTSRSPAGPASARRRRSGPAPASCPSGGNGH